MAQVLGLLLILMWGEVSAVVMITVAAMVSITLLGEWAIVTETPTAMANQYVETTTAIMTGGAAVVLTAPMTAARNLTRATAELRAQVADDFIKTACDTHSYVLLFS